MKGSTVDSAAARSSHHHRNANALTIPAGRCVVRQDIETTRDEIDELHFGYRAHPHHRRAARSADYRRLGNRCVDHPLITEFSEKAFGHLEGAAIDPDVFSEKEDTVVAFHLFPQSLSNRFK